MIPSLLTRLYALVYPMNLVELGLTEYWHTRHNDCFIDSNCRMMCVLLELADTVVPCEPEPEGGRSSPDYVAWAERTRIRRLLLADVH